jgi:hypothetical protein
LTPAVSLSGDDHMNIELTKEDFEGASLFGGGGVSL